VIAERTGIDVVADFRRRDMAAGGQGAPLAPAFHRAFLADPAEARVVLNLGGIANITLLPTDGRQPLAFDTGPANGLMDAWINQCQGLLYDADGGWAASGLHDPGLLRCLLAEPYFRLPPPKSTGKELFHLDWLRQRAELSRYDAVTVQATLLELSVISVADAIAAAGPCERVLVCGGGAHNGALMAGLQARLAVPVQSTQAIGVDPDWVEAMAFAWLARCHVQGQMLDLSAFTGAHRPTILGVALPGKRKQTIV
jgi:anhydro-N-acetylmuramic acid kinase